MNSSQSVFEPFLYGIFLIAELSQAKVHAPEK